MGCVMKPEEHIEHLKEQLSNYEKLYGQMESICLLTLREQRDFRQEVEMRFQAVDKRFDNLEERFDKLEGRFDKMEQRFEGLELLIRQKLCD